MKNSRLLALCLAAVAVGSAVGCWWYEAQRVVPKVMTVDLSRIDSAVMPAPTPAAKPASSTRREPLPNLDRRAAAPIPQARQAARETSRESRRAAAEKLATDVPGARVDFDDALGSPKFVGSPRGFLATAPGAAGDPPRVVKTFLDANVALFGHGSAVLDDARLVRDYATPHNGLRTLVWQQELDGVRIFESTLQAHVTKNGELVNVASRLVPNPATAAVKAPERIDVKSAVSAAGRDIGEPLPPAQIAENGPAEGPSRKQKLRSTRLLDISAETVWLPQDETAMRLCWEVIFTSKARGEMFRSLVDAETGDVVVRQSLTEYISNATYHVFTSDSPTPFSPGHPTPSTAQPPAVSRTAVTTPAYNTTASPNGWIDDGVNETRGNNVDAHTDSDANDVADTPRPQGSPNRVFAPPLDLSQSPSTYKDAAVVDLFYWNNLIHDRFYELGFTEAAGNFQNNNFGRGGSGNDAVQADAQDGSGTDNANFSTPPDGSAGRMQMYVFTGSTPDRDGDFDHEIVIHEYTHGLSNRLVGGGVGLSALQSRGMGEGWSDFYALCLLSEPTDDPNGAYPAGSYASYQLAGLATNYYYGIRRYPYSTDLNKNPLTFKDISPAQASSHPSVPMSPIGGGSADEVHNQGEVWCVALWDVRANLVAKHGAVAGNDLILQLATDGMKLAPANPNFLQARDAIIQADLVNNGGANRNELWTGFAKRGMGASASSPSSSSTNSLVEAYDFPDDLSVNPTAPQSAGGPIGGPFTPGVHTYTLRNNGTASLSWTAAKTQPWLTLSATSGTLAPGETATVSTTINDAANSLAVGNYSDTITFHNSVSGANLARSLTLSVSPPRVYYFGLDTDPGWTRSGQWAFGQPLGGGATSFGFADPTSGATGTNVLGVHLAGDYSTSVGGPYYVTSGPINLVGYASTKLQFQRWLNTDYQPYVYATIEVSTNGSTWTQIWSNGGVTIADTAWNRVQYDIAALADNKATVYVRWGYQIAGSAYPYSGWNIDDIEILGVPPNSLTVTLPGTMTEGDAPVNGTVTASPAPENNLVVNLTSSVPGRLGVPASVTILAGTGSASFTATVNNDTLLNGTASVNVAPSAMGWAAHATTVAVHDNESAALSVSLPPSATEGVGSVNGTVSIGAAPASDITVALSSDKANEAVPPATVVISAGQTSATFALGIVDDTRIDGAQTVAISASVTNWVPGGSSITVLDNENTQLVIALPAQVVEGTIGIGTISISGSLPDTLAIDVESSNPAQLQALSGATIPAGATSAQFTIAAVDDAALDGPQAVTFTASTPGFTPVSGEAIAADNDVHHFTWATIPSPQVSGAAFAVTITARDAAEAVVSGFTGTVALTAGAGVSVSPAATGDFTNGQWTGVVTVNGLANGVILTATHASGAAGASNAFNVIGADYTYPENWPTFGNGPGHTGHQPVALGTTAYQAGWTTTFPANANGINPVAISNGRVFVVPFITSTAGSISALDASNGAELWRKTYASSFAMNPPTVNAGRVYVQRTAGSSSQLLCVDALTGDPVWTAPFSAQNNRYFAPTVVNDGVWVNGGTSGGLYGFNTSDGSQRFFTSGGEANLWTPTYHEGTLYTWVGSSFRARNPSTGALLWNSVFSGSDEGVPVTAAGKAFVVGNFNVRAINLATHATAWTANFSTHIFKGPAAAVANGVVYVISNSDVKAYHADTGALLGTYATGDSTIHGQPIVTNDSLVVSSMFSAKTYLFTLGTFNPRQTLTAGGQATLANSVLYVAGTDGLLRTFYPGGQNVIGLTLAASGSEGSSTLTGTVTLSQVRAVDTEITLTSGNANRLSVPPSVTIPAGQSSATFAFNVVDDALANGSEAIAVTAKGVTYLLRTASANITVHDNEPVVLMLTTAASVTEGGAVQVNLTASMAPSRNVTVALTSSDIGEAILPPSAVIPAGQTSVTFTATAIDDGVIDGPQSATFMAQVTGWNHGTATLEVLDSRRDFAGDWPMLGNGPRHSGYQPMTLGTGAYQAAWTANYPDSFNTPNQVAVADGMVYVTPTVNNTAAYVSALDATTGTELWRTSFLPSSTLSAPTFDAGKVYVQRGKSVTPGNDSALHALDAASGAIEWSAPFNMQWSSFYPPTAAGETVWINGGTFGGLYGFNTSNGSQRFFNGTLEQYDMWTPSFDSGTLYSWVAGVFRAHDPATGANLWSSPLSASPSSMNTVAAIEARKAFVIGNSGLYALDLETHATLWTASGTFKGAPAVALGTVYALSGSDVKAYNSQTGALVGTYATGNSTIAGQPIVTDDSLIVSAADATYIFTLGTFTARQTIAAGGRPSLANAVLYLAGSDRVLRSYRLAGLVTLAVSVPAAATEGSGPLTGTVTLSQAQATDTAIRLVSGNTARVTVPESVLILAGQTSATFELNVVNDALLNGSRSIPIVGKGPSQLFLTESSAITINDNESAAISLNIPATSTEGDAPVTGTVTLSAAPDVNTAVDLSSSDPTEVTVPAKVTVLAGQTSATFTIVIVNDTQIDGGQAATITASLPGWAGTNKSISVSDNENTNLVLTGAATVTENSSQTYTITLSGTLASPLTVSLVSTNPSRLSVPASVTIPAGSTSATFSGTGVENALTDGNTNVNITASATGFTNAARTVLVRDNDLHHFDVSFIATSQNAGVPFSVTFFPRTIDNDGLVFNGNCSLSASSGGTSVPITPSSIAMSSVSTSASITVIGAGSGITLQISDGAGHTGASNAFNVLPGPLDHFAISSIASPQTAGTPFSVTIAAKDMFDNNVPSFSGTAALSAGPVATVSGTGSTFYNFLLGAGSQQRNQMLYLASEVGPAGKITSLAFRVRPDTTGTLGSFTVRLKHTGLTSQSVSWDASGWTTVYQGSQSVPVAGGGGNIWLVVPLSTPFQYDGTSNLLVDVTHNGSFVNGVAAGTAKSGVRTVFYLGSGNPDPKTWSGSTPTPNGSNGVLNMRVQLERTIAVTPTTTSDFVAGVWTGNVTIPDGASSIDLQANSGPAVFGNSDIFDVTGMPVLNVAEATGFHATANYAGPATPASASWTLSNTGNGNMAWSTAKNISALTLSPSSGNLAPGASVTVTASFNTAGLNPGTYAGTITFTNTNNGMGTTTRDASLLVVLPAPVLAPEPAVTGGTGNTVSWSAVPGAAEYEVQASANANFTGAVSSGWITGASHTFAPLADGGTYHYRVRARMHVPVAANVWTQATESEFATGTAVNVSTSANPGFVVLLSTGATWTEELNESGSSFSNTMFADVGTTLFRREALPATPGTPNTTPPLPINAAGDVEGLFVPPNSLVTSGRVSMPHTPGVIFQHGSIEGYIDLVYVSGADAQKGGFDLRMNSTATSYYTAYLSSASLTSANLSITKTINSSTTTLITSSNFSTDFPNENYKLRFRAQGSTLTASVWRVAVSGGSVVETPITLNTGTNSISVTDHSLGSGVVGLRAAGTSPNAVLYDDIVVNNDMSAFAPTGSLVSMPVGPSDFARWGTLSFTANAAPAGTSLTVDVLDASGALLAANVASGANLAAIPAVSAVSAIRLRANLATTNSLNTPSLDDWSVTWLLPINGEWSSAVASLQDAAPPTVIITSPAIAGSTAYTLAGTASDAFGVATILVNGSPATTANQFASWSIPVTLLPGRNSFTIQASDAVTPANGQTFTFDVICQADTNGNGLPDAWESEQGLTAADAALGDRDLDGLSNLAEFALCLDPNTSDGSRGYWITTEVNPADGNRYLVLHFRRRFGLDLAGWTIDVETSLDASGWSAGARCEEAQAPTAMPDGDAEVVHMRVLAPMKTGGARAAFVRLRMRPL